MKAKIESRPPTQVAVSKNVRRIVGIIAGAVVLYGGLFFYQKAHADESSDVPVAEEQVAEAEPLVSKDSTSSRVSKAFGFMFSGDASQIVAEVNDDLERRTVEAEAREAAILKREQELFEAESAVAAAKDKAQDRVDEVNRQREALTACVLGAIGAQAAEKEAK